MISIRSRLGLRLRHGMTTLRPILAGLMILALFGSASTVEAQRPAKLYRVGLLLPPSVLERADHVVE